MRAGLRPLGALLALLAVLAAGGCMPQGLAPTPSAALSQDAQTSTPVVVAPTATFTPTATPSPTTPTSPTPEATPAVRIVPGPLPPGLKVLFAEGFEGEGKSVVWMANVDDLSQVQIIARFPYHGAGQLPGGYVSPDGTKLAYILPGTHIQDGTLGVMKADGSDQRTLASPVLGWGVPGDVVWSPDSEHCAYTVADEQAPGSDEVWVVSADGSTRRQIGELPSIILLRWQGNWLYYYDGGHRFARLNVPSAAVEDIASLPGVSYCELAAAADRLVCLRGQPACLSVVTFPGTEGRVLAEQVNTQKLDFENYQFRAIWSPDATRVAYNPIIDGTHTEIAMVEVGSGIAHTIIRAAEGTYYLPLSWSPDGRFLAAWTVHLPASRGQYNHAIVDMDGSERRVYSVRPDSLPLGFFAWLQR